jgi:hypothetical protein
MGISTGQIVWCAMVAGNAPGTKMSTRASESTKRVLNRSVARVQATIRCVREQHSLAGKQQLRRFQANRIDSLVARDERIERDLAPHGAVYQPNPDC